MTTDVEGAMDAAREAVSSHPDELLGRLAEKVGAHAGAQAVFGDPVERDGVTVIPVAKVRYGFGGGAGSGADGSGDAGGGGGGGGGATASPVGFIEVTGEGARFVSHQDSAQHWPLVLAGGVCAWFVLRGLRALIR